MEAETHTLKDLKIHREITNVIGPYLPNGFINAIFNHMKNNKEDLYDHVYLKDSLTVADKLIHKSGDFTHTDKKLSFAIVALLESGRPLTRLYPYEASPGVAWMLLRLHAPTSFDKDELKFITQSCKPVYPKTLRPCVYTKIRLVVHNTQKLTDVVFQRYKKLYHEFIENNNRIDPNQEMDELFIDYYGPSGNLWGAVSYSALILFSSEISLFKREINKVLGDYSS